MLMKPKNTPSMFMVNVNDQYRWRRSNITCKRNHTREWILTLKLIRRPRRVQWHYELNLIGRRIHYKPSLSIILNGPCCLNRCRGKIIPMGLRNSMKYRFRNTVFCDCHSELFIFFVFSLYADWSHEQPDTSYPITSDRVLSQSSFSCLSLSLAHICCFLKQEPAHLCPFSIGNSLVSLALSSCWTLRTIGKANHCGLFLLRLLFILSLSLSLKKRQHKNKIVHPSSLLPFSLRSRTRARA